MARKFKVGFMGQVGDKILEVMIVRCEDCGALMMRSGQVDAHWRSGGFLCMWVGFFVSEVGSIKCD